MTDFENVKSAEIEKQHASLFIRGWLTDEFAAGRRPVYGYPRSSIPAVVGGEMEVKTGYMASGK